MKQVIDFIVENYKTIILVVACLLDVILFLIASFRKKKDLSLDDLLTHIPHLVLRAEEKFGAGKGVEKKKFVMDTLLALYEDLTGVKITSQSYVYETFDYMIEKVLSTPTKKGK